jgi:ElaB/YqjD/DUF883 family membrane-anchored ribosome-binding protein
MEDPMKFASILSAGVVALVLSGCQSAYYAAWEKVGYAKRDILESRVESARDSQQEAKEEITDALTAFGKVVSYDGGDLQTQYDRLSDQLEDSEAAAADVKQRVRDVDSVGEALFKEWKSELAKYSSADLRAKSEQQMKKTRARYDEMIRAMRRAEARLDPALQPMRDQVLFLKHNLNARAVAGLKGEVAKVDAQVNQLVAELNRSIAEANRFISDLESSGG